MTEALETAIRGALLQYARVRELKEYEGDAGCSERPAPLEDVEGSSATCAKRSKMMHVARMLVDSNPRIRNKGLSTDATGPRKAGWIAAGDSCVSLGVLASTFCCFITHVCYVLLADPRYQEGFKSTVGIFRDDENRLFLGKRSRADRRRVVACLEHAILR